MTVATTILDQLGGNKFIAMTGSKKFVGGDNFLSMQLAKNQSGANHLKITLTAMDDYTMEFIRFVMPKVKINKVTKDITVKPEILETVKVIEGVYCDQLQNLFTETTGLYTRL